MARRIVVEFLGEDKSLGRTADAVEGKTSKLGGVFKRMGVAAATGFAAVGAGAVAGGNYVFNYGAELEQMAMKADTVFGGQLGKVEKWANKNAAAMGLTSREATGLAANFADLLIPMGFSRKQAAQMSTDVVGLSGALSQWSGGTKSAAEVTEILNAAMLGETDGLKALGISISAAEVDAQLLKKGQDKLTGSARQQAEAMAIQSLVMAKSTDAQAAFAKGGSPLLTTQAKLKATFGEVRDSLVVALIPAVTKASDWFMNKGLPAAKEFGGWLRDNIPPIFDKIRSVIATFTGDGSGKFSKFVGDVKAIFRDGVSIVRSIWDKFGSDILTAVDGAMKSVSEILGGAFKVIRGIFKTVSSLLKGDWKGVWNGLKTILSGAISIQKGLIRGLFTAVRAIFSAGGRILKSAFSNIWDGIKTAARNGIGWIVDKVREIPGNLAKLGTKFFNAGKDLVGKIVSGIKGAAGFASDFAGEIWSAVKSAINSGIDKLNGLLEFSIKVGPKTFSVNPPNIGHLAAGTSSFGGGLAVVGEHGRELVALPGGAQVYPNHRTEAMFASARRGTQAAAAEERIEIVLQVDGQELHRALLKRKRRIGSLGLA